MDAAFFVLCFNFGFVEAWLSLVFVWVHHC